MGEGAIMKLGNEQVTLASYYVEDKVCYSS